MRNKAFVAFIFSLSCAINLPVCKADSQVDFDGTLVKDPCTLSVGALGEDKVVDFGTIINKYLYTNGHSPVQSFTILLQDCDTSLGNTVSFIFKGVEDIDQPGLLALDSTSGAKGVAIAINNANGTPVALNENSAESTLEDGDNQVTFQAYVKASPTALANSTITLGEFNATATFEMAYE